MTAPAGTATAEKRADNYPDWRPYCLLCETMGRMTETAYGFVCEGEGDFFRRRGCGNRINWNLTHYDGVKS